MSNLVVSNISDGTTSVGTSYVVNGSAKAWFNLNGTGTIAARDSFGISSFTDEGTAYYSASVSSSFANNGYAVGGMLEYTGSGQGIGIGFYPNDDMTASRSTFFATPDNSVAAGDNEYMVAILTGDLA